MSSGSRTGENRPIGERDAAWLKSFRALRSAVSVSGGLGSRTTARAELRERLTGEYARAVRLGDVCNVRRADMADVLEDLAAGVRAEEAIRDYYYSMTKENYARLGEIAKAAAVPEKDKAVGGNTP